MKLKITEITEGVKEYSPQGKKYTVYSWKINGQLKEDNGTITNLSNETIKTLSTWIKDQVKVNSTWNVQVETYNNYTSFKILDVKPKEEYQGKGNYQKKVSIEKFDMLVKHCWELSKKLYYDKENVGSNILIFDKILGCASVMVDVDSMRGDIDDKIDQANKQLDNAMDGSYKSDSEIPF